MIYIYHHQKRSFPPVPLSHEHCMVSRQKSYHSCYIRRREKTPNTNTKTKTWSNREATGYLNEWQSCHRAAKSDSVRVNACCQHSSSHLRLLGSAAFSPNSKELRQVWVGESLPITCKHRIIFTFLKWLTAVPVFLATAEQVLDLRLLICQLLQHVKNPSHLQIRNQNTTAWKSAIRTASGATHWFIVATQTQVLWFFAVGFFLMLLFWCFGCCCLFA